MIGCSPRWLRAHPYGHCGGVQGRAARGAARWTRAGRFRAM